MMDRPVIGLSVIIKKENKVLVGKRKNIIGRGQWAFPGGHLEFGETLEEGVIREITEETGIKVKNIKFQTAFDDLRPKEKAHYVTLVFTVEYKNGEVKNLEPDKCEGWQWVSWDFLSSLKTLKEGVFITIKNLLKQNFNPFEN